MLIEAIQRRLMQKKYLCTKIFLNMPAGVPEVLRTCISYMIECN